MPLVRFTIGEIVEEIDGARQRAEHEERGQGQSEGLGIEQPAAEECGSEHDQVLRPLLGTNGDEQEEQR
jgi:hypothetical protein